MSTTPTDCHGRRVVSLLKLLPWSKEVELKVLKFDKKIFRVYGITIGRGFGLVCMLSRFSYKVVKSTVPVAFVGLGRLRFLFSIEWIGDK